MTMPSILLLAYLGLNFASLAAYYLDKRASRSKHGRISERTLLVLALAGPFGAWSGMLAFHHKTRKRKFLLVPLFLILHLALFIGIAARLI